MVIRYFLLSHLFFFILQVPQRIQNIEKRSEKCVGVKIKSITTTLHMVNASILEEKRKNVMKIAFYTF